LSSYFGFELDKIKAADEERGRVNREEWSKSVREEARVLEQERAERMERIASVELEKIVGKPAGGVSEKDILIFFARKYRLPLYFVSSD